MAASKPFFGLSRRGLRTGAQPISYLMAQAVDNPNLISLAAGLVDDQTLPVKQTARLAGKMFAECGAGQVALQYGSTAGLAELRQLLLEHMAGLDGLGPQDLGVTSDDVVITSGSQQMLFILSDILIDPGDIVITAWPSYFVYTGTLLSMGAEVRAVEMDDDGIRPDDLRAVLQSLADEDKLAKVKIVYIQSYHQNPTGITLSADRREQVAEIVRSFSTQRRILIIEDAAYREMTYEGQAPPSIKKYDPSNELVAITQTFSKPFAPGVRTGYCLLPRDLVEPVMLQKGNHDFGSGNLCQHLLLAAIKQGVYHDHLSELRRRYAAKRDVMLESLDKCLGGGDVRWKRPTGGLYVYLTFPEEVDTGREGKLFKAALDAGVLYVPGEYCFGPDPTRTPPRNTMRLCYGKADIEGIREGIARLAQAVKAAT